MNVAEAIVKFRADLADVNRAFQQTLPQQAGQSGRTAGTAFSQGMNRFATAGALASGAFFAGAIEGGVKFEDQLRTINTVAGLTDDQLASVGDDIQALSRETGKSTDDLAAGFYDLVSAGVSADQAIGVLRDSAKFATGALGSTAESVDLVTSVLNAYGLEASESTRVTDIFAKAVADGKVTAAELGASMAQIAPIAASAGISMEEVSAGFAELTAKGVPATQAATQMRAAISALLTPNTALNRVTAQTGINFKELAKEKGLAVALEELRKATSKSGGEFDKFQAVLLDFEEDAKNGEADFADLGDVVNEFRDNLGLTRDEADRFTDMVGKRGMGEALQFLRKQLAAGDAGFAEALGSVEAYNFALATTGENADTFAEQIVETGKASGIAQKQYDEASKSAQKQGERLLATIQTFAQDVGGPFVGGLGQGVFALNQLGIAFGLPLSPAKLLGAGIGGLTKKLIPTLIRALAPSVILPAISAAASALGAGISTLISIGMAAFPIILIGVIVAALIYLITNPEAREKALEVGGMILNAIIDALKAIVGFVADIVGGIIDTFARGAGQVVETILAIPKRVLGWVGDLLGQAGKIGNGTVGKIGKMVIDVVAAILSIPVKAIGWVAGLVGTAINAAVQFGANILGMVGDAVRWILGIPGKILGGLVRGMADLGVQAANALLGPLKAAADLAADIIGSITGKPTVKRNFPSVKNLPTTTFTSLTLSGRRYAEGEERTTEGLAYLHDDEMVVPRGPANVLRQAMGGADWRGLTAAFAGGGEIHYHIPLNVEGVLPVRTTRDLSREMRRLGDMNLLPGRSVPARYPVDA